MDNLLHSMTQYQYLPMKGKLYLQEIFHIWPSFHSWANMKHLVSDVAVTRGDGKQSFLMCCGHILFSSAFVPVLAQVPCHSGRGHWIISVIGVQGNFNCQLDTVTWEQRHNWVTVPVRLACRNVAGRSFHLDIGGPRTFWVALSLRLMGGDFIRELDESESESESSQELCCSVASASSFCLSSDLPSLHRRSCYLKHCKGNTVRETL